MSYQDTCCRGESYTSAEMQSYSTAPANWAKIKWELSYHDQKIRQTPTHDTQKHWTAVSTLLVLFSNVYHDLHHWRSNQRSQIAEPKLYNQANSSYCTQVMPNNLNASCKLHPYSLQRTQSPPGPCLPKRIRNTHPCNYYELKVKDIDVYYSFLSKGIILWIEKEKQ